MKLAEVPVERAPTPERKRISNRRNALKSTGPRTIEGKAKSRWNAVKHGLLSQSLLIKTSDICEDPKAFEHLLKSLRDDLTPLGALEEMFVERIAVCYWRLSRCLQAESGAIVLATAGRNERTISSLSRSAQQLNDFPIPGNRLHDYCKTSFGVRAILNVLNELKDDYETTGKIGDVTLNKLIPIYGTDENSFAVMVKVMDHLSAERRKKCPASDKTAKPDDLLLEFIDKEIKRQESIESRLKDYEIERLDADIAHHHVPLSDNAETLLRYETAIERQLYRAIDQLERLQDRRSAVIGTKPLRLDVNVRN